MCKVRLPGVLLKGLETDSKTQNVGVGMGPLCYICAIEEDAVINGTLIVVQKQCVRPVIYKENLGINHSQY
jgi:hypothetical protein